MLVATRSRRAAILYPVADVRLLQARRGRARPRAVEVPLDARFELDEAAMRARDRASTARASCSSRCRTTRPARCGAWTSRSSSRRAHRDTVIVSDEAYFAYSGQTNLPRSPTHPNLVVMRTLSKIGLAGLRVGFTIASPAIAQLLEKVRPPYNLSLARSARGGVRCSREAARLVRRARRRGRSPSARASPPRSRARRGVRERGKSLARALRAGRARDVAERSPIAACSCATSTPGPLAGCLRITVGTPAENACLADSRAL